MSNYVKTVNFAAKDALLTGDSNKLIKGTEIGTEYDNIATASATKANKISGGANNDIVAQDASGDIQNGAIALINAVYPVGSIYVSTSSTNPSSTFGTGTWVALGDKQTLVQQGTYSAGSTGGSSTAIVGNHTHTWSDTSSSNGAHTHTANVGLSSTGATTSAGINIVNDADPGALTTSSAGAHTHNVSGTTSDASGAASTTNANMPPYLAVYMWKRTA